MRYTQYRGLAQVTNWVKLKFGAMNLKKLATWKWKQKKSSPGRGAEKDFCGKFFFCASVFPISNAKTCLGVIVKAGFFLQAEPCRYKFCRAAFYTDLFSGLIAVGVVALPVPAVGAHLLNAVLGLPAQLALGLAGVTPALGNVAGAARVDNIGNLLAAGLAEGVDDVQHAVAVAGAQIADEQAGLLLQLLDGRHVAAGQIHHVDVVAHAGASGVG